MRSWLAALAIALAIAGPTTVRADDTANRVVIDQVDLEPSILTGHRLRATITATSLQGQRLDLNEPKAIKAFAGTTEIKAPYLVGAFGGSDLDTAIIFIVQSTFDYTDVLAGIADAYESTLLEKLPARTQVAVMTYGSESIKATSKLGTAKVALGKFREVTADPDSVTGDPVLLDSIERALPILKKAKTDPPNRPLRKMIVVISDGRDLSNDRDRVTRLGLRADKEGVRIHTFAWTPKDLRRPLLLLGELSKRSHGTFRWLRRSDSWGATFGQLADEIGKQYVVTFYLGKDDPSIAGKKLRIETTGRVQATSANEVKIPALGCQGTPCEAGYCLADKCVVPRGDTGRGIFGWILLVVGIAVGAIVVLGFIGFLLSKRQARQQMMPMPGMPVGMMPPPSVPPGSIPPPGSVPPTKKKKEKKQKQPDAQSVPPAAVPAVAPTSGPRLYIMSGPRTGETLALRHGFMIGKQPGCDLVIDDGYTSSQHAQFGMDHFKNCRLYDHNSTNGTFVNGVRVQEYVLQHGMTIRIGSTELRFLAE